MREHLTRVLEAADRDWRNNVGEHDRASLDRMFVASGFARQAPRAWDAKVRDWCGMAVGLWLQDGGMNHRFGRSFLHCFNVEAFFTYGFRKNVNPKRLDTHAQVDGQWVRIERMHGGSPRRWLERDAVKARATANASSPDLDLFAPGDVVLFDWDAVNDADHITMCRSWDGRVLTTIEGNASGLGPDGKRRADSVVERKLDMGKQRDRKLVYGVGRLSPSDFGSYPVKPREAL